MSNLKRRDVLRGAGTSALGLSLRAAITGLPVPFLMSGRVHAAQSAAKITIVATSGAGESITTVGPGAYDGPFSDHFSQPTSGQVDGSEIPDLTVNGVNLTTDDLSASVEMQLGGERVRVARMWSALPAAMREHMVWFHHRTGASIHPQYPAVLRCNGTLRSSIGRGDEQLPSAIAQETAALLGTTTADPFVLSGSGFTSNGSPLASYTPTRLKTLLGALGGNEGGFENFGALRDFYLDKAYKKTREQGTPSQKRFLSQMASSREEAVAFGDELASLIETVETDEIDDQLRVAAALAKLRIAPVIVVKFRFTEDNHVPDGPTVEVGHSLRSMQHMDTMWKALTDFGVVDDVLYTTSTVFGRTPRLSDNNGRGHYGNLCTGLMIGTHLSGKVVGGFEVSDGGRLVASGINSTTGTAQSPDVPADSTLASYYKSILLAAGVPSERRDVRFPYDREVTSFL